MMYVCMYVCMYYKYRISTYSIGRRDNVYMYVWRCIGMEYLSAYLRHNDSLLELFADDCLAGDDGMLALQHGLLANKVGGSG